MSLFNYGEFVLHSGGVSRFKIDCDALTMDDWQGLAKAIVSKLPPFRLVVGIPRGGLAFAAALEPYVAKSGQILVVDDVWTTGASMEQAASAYRGNGDDPIGVVLFARSVTPAWVFPIFTVERLLSPW